MSNLVRTWTWITPELEKKLRHEAVDKGIRLAELISGILTDHLAQESTNGDER